MNIGHCLKRDSTCMRRARESLAPRPPHAYHKLDESDNHEYAMLCYAPSQSPRCNKPSGPHIYLERENKKLSMVSKYVS